MAKAASAAVADVFDHTGKFSRALPGEDQPAFDGLSAKAIEGDIEGFLRDETIIHFFEGRVEWKCPRFIKCGFPE